MSEDPPSDRHQYSAETDIARLKERCIALKDEMGEMRGVVMDIKALLLTHISSSGERHAQLLATFNQHNLEDAVVHQRVLSLQQDIDDARAESKRDPVTFWTSIAAAGTAVGAIFAAIHGGKP
jgi:hypothetical protein